MTAMQEVTTTSSDTSRPRIFLCYAKQDIQKAAEIFDYLTRAGAAPWLDQRCLVHGDLWDAEIERAVASADAFVPFLRSGFDDVGYRQKEVHLAIEALKRRPPGRGFIIPFVIEPCELPSWCRPFHAGSAYLTRTTTLDELRRAIEKHTGWPLRGGGYSRAARSSASGAFDALDDPSGSLIQSHTFESFVVGSSNTLACAAAQAVAVSPGTRFNPLFIHSDHGLGKTHLVNAVGHAVVARNPQAQVLYLSAQTFVTALIAALREGRASEFTHRFKSLDLLILDDVQFLAGRERTQEEMFHIFNAMYGAGRQIVLASGRPPRDIPDLEAGLVSRFEWGVVVDIQPAEIQMLAEILRRNAVRKGLQVSRKAAEFVAGRMGGNVRRLDGALAQLAAEASQESRSKLTLSFVRNALQSREGSARDVPGVVTLFDIQRAVAEHFGLTAADLQSKRRLKAVNEPRHIAMYLSRKLVGASFPMIGDAFGGRDRAAALRAYSSISRCMSSDPNLRAAVELLERSLVAVY